MAHLRFAAVLRWSSPPCCVIVADTGRAAHRDRTALLGIAPERAHHRARIRAAWPRRTPSTPSFAGRAAVDRRHRRDRRQRDVHRHGPGGRGGRHHRDDGQGPRRGQEDHRHRIGRQPPGSRASSATDRRSDLAVLRIDDDLPAATFDDDDPVTGSLVLAVAMRPGTAAGHPTPVIYAGTVVSSGMTVAGRSRRRPPSRPPPSERRSTTTTSVAPCSTARDTWSACSSSPPGVGTSSMSVFLPGGLVAGVARQLVSSGVGRTRMAGRRRSDRRRRRR